MIEYKTSLPITFLRLTNHSWWLSISPLFFVYVVICHDHLGQIIIHAIADSWLCCVEVGRETEDVLGSSPFSSIQG